VKALIFLILLSLIPKVFFTQDSYNEDELISRFRPGAMWYYTGFKPAEIGKARKYDRLIVDVLYNDWHGKMVKPFSVNPSSIGFNLNFMIEKPLTKNNTMSLAYGLSYGLFRVNSTNFFVRNQIVNNSIGSTQMVENIDQYGIEKSLFKLHSLSVPFELRFRGKNWKHAKIHFGARVSYQFRGVTSLSTKENGITNEQKTIGFYDLNPINFSTHLRFGIRNWSLYASYGFLPFFKDPVSIQLRPLQFGLSLSLF
jgi:hypothetical protein